MQGIDDREKGRRRKRRKGEKGRRRERKKEGKRKGEGEVEKYGTNIR